MYLESTGLFRRIFLPIIIFLKSLLDDSFLLLKKRELSNNTSNSSSFVFPIL